MSKHHTDAVVIEQLGTRALTSHFNVTRQAVAQWRADGVPRTLRNAVVLLGQSLGHDMSDFEPDQA